MSHIPDDFGDYIQGRFPPSVPIMSQPKVRLRIEPRKFDPQYRKAGEKSSKRKTRHFNQYRFWSIVSYIGTMGLIIVLAFLVSLLIHKSS